MPAEGVPMRQAREILRLTFSRRASRGSISSIICSGAYQDGGTASHRLTFARCCGSLYC